MLFNIARSEAEWIKYYCHSSFKTSEYLNENTILSFYDIAQPIGYSKVYTPLITKTCMGTVIGLENNQDKQVFKTTRNHDQNLYTVFEWYIYNKLLNYQELIDLILN